MSLVERAMLFALDRDSELRARYLRQRWRSLGVEPGRDRHVGTGRGRHGIVIKAG